ncbi:MAG: lysylphosphatidylglycerol synthase transmembrane domain-containing protein [Marinilabiliaceae bacterium]|jgi:uncharacterized protein (TIRG00374 family)|nr:lysylphosphatidylglycerol synthase transmembrane domain-containing protein [Marinilabiliaceae bacterium]
MARLTRKEVVRRIRPRNIILPVAIGLIIVALLLRREYSQDALSNLSFERKSFFFLLIALGCMICRDLGYMIRIRILTDNDLTWKQAFRVIMLWEFTSSISPSTIGGTAVALVFIHKEGISVGRSSSVVLLTSFLDELYFVIMFPVLFIIIGGNNLFMQEGMLSGRQWFSNELFLIAIIGYIIKLIWVILVGYGLFLNPRGLRSLIIKIFKLPGLKRWHEAAVNAGDDIITSSKHISSKPFHFWIKAGLATFLSWTARYWVANAVLTAFFEVREHFLIFARQLVMFIMMIISPTPGGSGIAELIFSRYLSDFVPVDADHIAATALAIALIWRAISYYPYLIAGIIIAPGWIRKSFITKKEKNPGMEKD